jgi:hypothetical protein
LLANKADFKERTVWEKTALGRASQKEHEENLKSL